MNIKPRTIQKFLGGKPIWYLGLIDYNPSKYLYSYDTSNLIDGDMKDSKWSPWKSDISGNEQGRYLPTSGYGNFGVDNDHYKYTRGVEEQDYYKNFGQTLLDNNRNFTEVGKAWALAVDKLLPANSKATFFDENGNLRTSWTTQYKDAHNRSAKTFNNLKDYVNYVRNDLILGAIHNVFCDTW